MSFGKLYRKLYQPIFKRKIVFSQSDEEGIDMVQMFAKQMEKIEELTLYIIEQNKQIESMKSEIAQLQKR